MTIAGPPTGDDGALTRDDLALDALRRVPGIIWWVWGQDLRVVIADGMGLRGPDGPPLAHEGKLISEIVPSEVHAEVEDHARAALRGESRSWEYRASDDAAWMAESGPIASDDGTIIGGMLLSRNVSAERRAREELELSERTYRFLAEHPTDVIARFSDDDTLLWISQSVEALLGHRPDDLIGTRPWALVHPDDLPQLEGFVGPPPAGEHRRQTYRVRHRSGHYLWVDSTVHAVPTNPHEHVIVSRDITERVETERAMRIAHSALAERAVELERFAGSAAHDLGEPLAVLRTTLGAIQPRTASARQLVQHATHVVDEMQRLIDAYLRYARLDQTDLDIEPVPLGDVLEEVRLLSDARLRACGARLMWDALPVVHADRVLLRQVLQNLVSNAVKFTNDHPPRVEVTAEIDADGIVTVSVTDDGPGIPEKDRTHVLGEFTRLAEDEAGHGIGLTSAARIAERHGGRLWIEAAPGSGARVRFTLPAGDPEG